MKYILYISCIIIFFFSCNKETDIKYFNGDIVFYEESNVIENLKGEKIIFDDIYTGEMIIHDSLAFFVSSKYPGYLLSIFNINNGHHIGNYLNKGNGPDDFLAVNIMNHVFQENNCSNIWLYAYNEQKIIELNVNKVLIGENLPLDTIFNFSWSDYHMAPFNYLFRLNKDKVIAKVPLESLFNNGKEFTPPKYKIIDFNTKKESKEYILYSETIEKKTENQPLSMYYLSTDQIRPDLQKIAISMGLLSQINILDLESGELKCVRKINTPSFSEIIKKDIQDYKIYYKSTSTDNNFIYSLYVNKDFNLKNIPSSNEVHIFDWEGNFIKKIILDQYIDKIRLDSKRNILYGKSEKNDNIYRFYLN